MLMCCCAAAPFLMSCSEESNDGKKEECPATCPKGCKEDGVTCKEEVKPECPESCTNGCKEDGTTCKEEVKPECPETCTNGCEEDGVTCREAKPTCPETCTNGCEADGVTCREVKQKCPAECPKGTKCNYEKGECETIPMFSCPSKCPDDAYCDETTSNQCMKKVAEETCPVCPDGSLCDDTTAGKCVQDGKSICPKCSEGSRCDETKGRCVTAGGDDACPECAVGICDETKHVCVMDSQEQVCPKCASGSYCNETTMGHCVQDSNPNLPGCPACPQGAYCDDTTNGLCRNKGYVEPEIHECEPGELRCYRDVLQKCSDSFVFVDEENCAAHNEEEGADMKACFANSKGKIGCHITECTPGTSKCKSNEIQYCDEFHQYQLGENCLSKEETPICETAGNAASCVAKCENGTSKCVGKTIMACNESGLFKLSKTCKATQDCVQTDESASCVDHECKANESKCEGSVLYTCSNGWWKAGTNCEVIGELCIQNEKTASCVERKCEENKKTCDGIYLRTCEKNALVNTSCKSLGSDYQCIEKVAGQAECKEVIVFNLGMSDKDNDSIADWIECNYEEETKDEDIDYSKCDAIDTDGDTTPDYLDEDSDGDTIPDSEEANNDRGRYEPDDADYDEIPNYRDLDSDNNGIPDKDEYQNGRDLDNNGTPDYLDYDNDGDGFSDAEEIHGIIVTKPAPPEGHFSGSCDGRNLIGDASNPVDCDGDTTPDYNDPDSDGDGLPDRIEGMIRLASNGFLARYSKDIDGDGIDDKTECGVDIESENLSLSSCLDSDCYNTKDENGCYVYGYNSASCDGIPDMLEKDSDGDGLTDAFERKWLSDATKTDTDGDCVTDLIEYGAQTDPTNPKDNPQTKGNFVFVVPYLEASSPKKQSLSFETSVQAMDLFFIFDYTGSMGDEIASLATGLNKILDTLQCKDYNRECLDNSDCNDIENAICSESGRCIQSPSFGDGCIDKMQSGIGFYTNLDTFWVGSVVSKDVQSTLDALNARFYSYTTTNPAYSVACLPGSMEPPYQSPICALVGNEIYDGIQYCKNMYSKSCKVAPTALTGCGTYSSCKIGCSTNSSRIGCAGFRRDAIRIIIQAFDEDDCIYNTGGNERCPAFQSDIGKVLKNFKTRFIGLWGSYTQSIAQDISQQVNGTNKYAYKATDSELANKTLQGIREITQGMPLDITSSIEDIDENASKLIEKLEINLAGGDIVQNRRCAKITNTITDSGSITPGISQLTPGTVVCYDVIPVENQSIFPAKDEPQVFKARVKLSGDGSVLNSGVAYFLVPPVIEDDKGEAGE